MLPVDAERASLARFHAGQREELEALYREQLATVDRAVGRILGAADRESVVQEVFLRIVASEDLRKNFRGGSMSAWIATVARNQAIDYLRRQRREQDFDEHRLDDVEAEQRAREHERKTEARMLIERFRKEQLPDKWQGVFQARFIDHLDQREAARRLGMHRTTLAYQELRVRSLLRRFLLGGEAR